MPRVHVPVQLRWADLDAYGHVNNANLLRLLEEARILVFWARPDDPDAPATAVIPNGDGADTMTFVARQEIEYLAPIPYLRDPIDIQLWVGKLGGASFEICYEVWSPVGATEPVLYARASTTGVVVDAATQRPRKMTDAERAAWGTILDEPIAFTRR